MSQSNQKRFIALALVILCGVVASVYFQKPPVLPAVILLPPGPLVVKSGRVPDRWIPNKWTWLHRACRFLRGPDRQLVFGIKNIESADSVATIMARNSLSQPQAETNGVAIWILPENSIKKSAGAETILCSARVSTVERMLSTVTAMEGSASYTTTLFGRLEKDTVDLTSLVVIASETETNLFPAVRTQIPFGSALFLLDVRHPELATNRTEIVITAEEIDAAGNKVHAKK